MADTRTTTRYHIGSRLTVHFGNLEGILSSDWNQIQDEHKLPSANRRTNRTNQPSNRGLSPTIPWLVRSVCPSVCGWKLVLILDLIPVTAKNSLQVAEV